MFSPAFIEKFQVRINTYHSVPLQQVLLFLNTFERVEYKRGEVIIKEGQVCRQLFYVVKGVLRTYTVEDGRDINVHFYFQDELASEFRSLSSEEPSARNLAALVPVVLLASNRSTYLPLFENSIELASAGLRFFRDMYLNEEEHNIMLKTLNAEDRYQYILQQQPHMIERIPLRHLATYLGMSRENLSRIRNKLNFHQ